MNWRIKTKWWLHYGIVLCTHTHIHMRNAKQIKVVYINSYKAHDERKDLKKVEKKNNKEYDLRIIIFNEVVLFPVEIHGLNHFKHKSNWKWAHIRSDGARKKTEKNAERTKKKNNFFSLLQRIYARKGMRDVKEKENRRGISKTEKFYMVALSISFPFHCVCLMRWTLFFLFLVSFFFFCFCFMHVLYPWFCILSNLKSFSRMFIHSHWVSIQKHWYSS